MANTLTTRFVFQDKDVEKVDSLRSKLTETNALANSLGKDSSFGKNIGLEATKSTASLNKLGKEVDSLKTKTETFAPQPRISRHYETEALETKKSVDSINRSIDSLKTPVGNPGSDSVKRTADFGKDSSKNPFAGPALDITGKIERELGVIEKKSDDVRKSFSSIAATRLDAGQASHLTKEIVRASDRSRQLSTDIVNIRKELANPNRKSSIAFLTDELKGAEREAEKLNRKLNSLPSQAGGGSGAQNRTPGASAQNLRLSSFQKTNLSYQVNDVLTGLASGQNPTQILAQQGGQIAQIFSPAQATALVSAYAGLATVAAAGAAAIALTYKITGDIRAEAERRLKAEEMITAAINKQRIAQIDSLKEFKKLRDEAESRRKFSFTLDDGNVEELRARRATAEKLLNLNPAGDGAGRNKDTILEIDARLSEIQKRNNNAANDAFNQRWDNWKKSNEDAIRAEEKHNALLKAKAEDIEKAKEKVKDLGKTYRDVADDLFLRTNSNNPFVTLFSEADKSLQTLRQNTKGLSAELIATFEQVEAKANNLKLFETRIDNNLQAFDLRERAKDLRSDNRTALKIDDPNKFFEDFIEAGLKQISPANGGRRFNLTGAGNSTQGFSQSDARNDLLFTYERTGGFQESRGGQGFGNNLGGVFRRRRNFEDLTEAGKRDFAEKSNKTEVNLSFNDRLERQRAIVYDGAFTDEQKALADRKFLALTSGVNPNELSGQNREALALVAERQAARLEKSESDAKAERAKDAKIKEQIAKDLAKIREVAEKDGLKGIENLVRIVDETGGGVQLPAGPTAADTQAAYDKSYTGGTFYEAAAKKN